MTDVFTLAGRRQISRKAGFRPASMPLTLRRARLPWRLPSRLVPGASEYDTVKPTAASRRAASPDRGMPIRAKRGFRDRRGRGAGSTQQRVGAAGKQRDCDHKDAGIVTEAPCSALSAGSAAANPVSWVSAGWRLPSLAPLRRRRNRTSRQPEYPDRAADQSGHTPPRHPGA